MDPTIYQRDRGELNWDARSIHAGTVLGDGSTNLSHSKSGFYASGANRDQPTGYDQYMQQGPQRGATPVGLQPGGYEMSRLGSEANLPLLASRSTTSFLGANTNDSQHSLHDRSPSIGPGGGPNYFSSPTQGNPPYHHHPQERSGSSMGYHGRAGSTGFDQTVASMGYHNRAGSAGFDQTVASAAGMYPPQQQQQQYVDRTQSPSVYQQRAGSAMGYQQQGPQYPPVNPNDAGTPSRYYTPSPTPRERGNDGNMAGRGANRQNY